MLQNLSMLKEMYTGNQSSFLLLSFIQVNVLTHAKNWSDSVIKLEC